MDDSGTSRRFFFGRRTSCENVKPPRFHLSSDLDLFGKPISALSRHRIHQLSDIREASGSSRTTTVKRYPSGMTDGAKELPSTPAAPHDARSETISSEYATPAKHPAGREMPSNALGSRATSTVSLPLRDVPERRSSASIFAQSLGGSRQASVQDLPSWKLPPIPNAPSAVPHRGRADSPVRQALNRAPQSSEAVRRSPSRTFIKTTPPLDVLDKGSLRHDRVVLSACLPSPLFVGGGTVEGQVSLEVDGGVARKTKLKALHISKLSIDVIGVEEVSDGRRWIFLSLGSELFDEDHPPPPALVTSQLPIQGSELCWQLKPSSAIIPFCVNLPLNLGPPPYLSKQACIRYILCPAAHIKIGDKRSVVRQTWTIQMLTVHNPEKALASLPSPLLATDSLTLAYLPEVQIVKLTAGLHRQTWVNGGMIFIDIHVTNKSGKAIKKIEVQLEKTTLWYSHAAAGTAEKSASHLRLPKRTDADIVSASLIKKCKDWKGILSQSSEIRTCELEVPRGHVTISTGRYFEVRYFVNVVVAVTMFKSVSAQLPVTIIHMNSLDILPNSLAQVAAAIEARRAKTLPVARDAPIHQQFHQQYHQGEAFSAARRQSLDRARRAAGVVAANDVSLLTQDLDHSPRRFGKSTAHSRGRQSALGTGVSNENITPGREDVASSSHLHNLLHSNCYHCHLLFSEHGRKLSATGSHPGPKLPRLQVSTSGLGFSESEFEVPPDSPRKVMLSEQERRMINQQRELNMQRQWSQNSGKRNNVRKREAKQQEICATEYTGWKNVAAGPDTGPKQPEYGNLSVGDVGSQSSAKFSHRAGKTNGKAPMRARSKTNPNRPLSSAGPSKHRRGP